MSYLPDDVATALRSIPMSVREQANEIRLRSDKPPVVMTAEKMILPTNAKNLSQKQITAIFERLCDYSVYSYQSEICQGFITLRGGHRVGICGTAAKDKNGERTVKYISSVNIRLASEHIGCADELMRRVFNDSICGVLIAGPPCSGKTTILRDVALSLSSERWKKKVVIIDERGEIAAMYHGTAQNTIGLSCDVLNCYPKPEGILLAIRSMAPDVIICDEVGSEEDASAICEGLKSGVCVISTAHACDVKELYSRRMLLPALDTGAFKRIAFLKGGACRGEVSEIIEV